MMEMLRYDATGAFFESDGLKQAALTALLPKLDAARAEVLADAFAWVEGADVPEEKVPLDAGFHKLPDRLLADFNAKGASSQLGQIKQAADRIAAENDRVVFLGIGGSYMGARALFESLCHPYHNELPRPCRRDRPRIYFDGNNVDNDATTGLLGLFGAAHPEKKCDSDSDASDPNKSWAISVISKSGGTLETAAAFRLYLKQMASECNGNQEAMASRIVPVTGPSGKLDELSRALGCKDVFRIPDGVGGRFSILTPVGLLPAAIMGLDVEKILAGAVAMNEHFRTAPSAENVVLQFVGVSHLLEKNHGCNIRVLSTWGSLLESTGLWYDQLLAESLGKEELGATPLTVVNTRDLHSRGQQHQEGRLDKFITNLIVEKSKKAPLTIGKSAFDQDQLNELADKSLPDILSAAIAGTNKAYKDVKRPTADLIMPQLDEHTIGQLLQMLMLATVLEGRLLDINPYGQPGVEAYKKNMNAILRGE